MTSHPFFSLTGYTRENSVWGPMNNLNALDTDNLRNITTITGTVEDVDPDNYTCTVLPSSKVGQLTEVLWASPWFNCTTGAGFSHRPEIHSTVVVSKLPTGKWVIIGTIPQLDKSGLDESGSVFKNKKPELGEGDMQLSTDAGNLIEVQKDSHRIAIQNAEYCKVLLEDIENLIRLHSIRMLIENAAGRVDMNHNDESGNSTTTVTLYKNRDDKENFIKATMGTLEDKESIFSLNISNKVGLTVKTDGKVELTCTELTINTIGSTKVNSNDGVKLASPKIDLETTGNLILKAGGNVQLEGASIKETSGGSIIREAGGSIKDAGGTIMHTRGSGTTPSVQYTKVKFENEDKEALTSDRKEPPGATAPTSPSASVEVTSVSTTPTAEGASLNNLANSVAAADIPPAAQLNALSDQLSAANFNALATNPVSAISLMMGDVGEALNSVLPENLTLPTDPNAQIICQELSRSKINGVPYAEGVMTIKDSSGIVLGSYNYVNGGLNYMPCLPQTECQLICEAEPDVTDLVAMSAKNGDSIQSWKFIVSDIYDEELTGNVRTGISIHPKSGNSKGTRGTIGILGSTDQLADCRKNLLAVLQSSPGGVNMKITRK